MTETNAGGMEQDITHKIELYLLEVFKTLLEHEMRKSRRYKDPLSLVCIALDAEPDTLQIHQSAEMVVINVLDVELRDTDIPCRDGREFLILLPSTDEKGAHHACERLERSLNITTRTSSGAAFQVSAFIGLASLGDDPASSSKKLMENARRAMQHARTTRSLTTVLFSSMQ